MSTTNDGSDFALPGQYMDFQPSTGDQVVREQWFGFTQRERAAIDLRVPDSGSEWLDEMIREGRRLDMATASLSGLFSNVNTVPKDDETFQQVYAKASEASLAIADALLRASEQ